MKEIEEINIRLKASSESGIFHDSRADSRLQIQVINILIDKINELIFEFNKSNLNNQ